MVASYTTNNLAKADNRMTFSDNNTKPIRGDGAIILKLHV